jgi:signal transduction histidine kinase
MTYRKREGRRIVAEVSASTIVVESQTSIVMCARDITQRKLSEQQLQVLNRVLRHNLRNDMNVIHGCGNILSSKVDNNELEKHTRRIVETSNDLIALSEKTRELNKVIQWHQDPRHIDIIQIIDNLRRDFEEKYSAASVRMELPEEANVVADDRINYVLDELIENAIKHNDRGEPLVEISVIVTQETICIEIMDDGPGISPQEHAVLVGKETPLLHGSGLGLWIVNWIVTSVGGELDLDTNEPRGSVVTVTLPRSTAGNKSKLPNTS